MSVLNIKRSGVAKINRNKRIEQGITYVTSSTGGGGGTSSGVNYWARDEENQLLTPVTDGDSVQTINSSGSTPFYGTLAPGELQLRSNQIALSFEIPSYPTNTTVLFTDALYSVGNEFSVGYIISATASGDWSGTNNGIIYDLQVTKEGAVDPVSRLKVNKDGHILLQSVSEYVGIKTTAPKSHLHNGGSVGRRWRKTSVAVTLADDDDILICTGSSSFTVTLPDAGACTDRCYSVRNKGTGTITLDPYSSQTIDDNATKTIAAGGVCVFISDGSNWEIVI